MHLVSLARQIVRVLGPRVSLRRRRTHPHREFAQIFGGGVPGPRAARGLAAARGLDRREPALQPAFAAAGIAPTPLHSRHGRACPGHPRIRLEAVACRATRSRGMVPPTCQEGVTRGARSCSRECGDRPIRRPDRGDQSIACGRHRGSEEGPLCQRSRRSASSACGMGCGAGQGRRGWARGPHAPRRAIGWSASRARRQPRSAPPATSPTRPIARRSSTAAAAQDIRYFFYIGGNDSADTCRIVSEKAAGARYDLRCFHVPKTIDNDLLENDHTPGFPSAARYVTLALMGDALDNASLGGIKINVIMGRNAGFLTAAASLARGQASTGAAPADRPAPHLIYLPEVPFSTDAFLADVEAVYGKLGRCQIAVSEGIRDDKGEEIGPKLMRGRGRGRRPWQCAALGLGRARRRARRPRQDGAHAERGQGPARARRHLRLYPALLAAPLPRRCGRGAARLAATRRSLPRRAMRNASVIIRRTSNAPDAYASECGRADLLGRGAAHASCAAGVHLRHQRCERRLPRLLPPARR